MKNRGEHDQDTVIYVCLGHVDPIERTVRRGDLNAQRECPECAAREARRTTREPCQAKP